MNRPQYLYIIVALVMASCQKPFEYKYQDKGKPIQCQGLDNALLHEALYSFQEDISSYYRDPDVIAGSDRFYMQGLAAYVSDGMFGTAPYTLIVSDHSKEVLEQLKMHPDIWNPDGSVSKLNHQSELVLCLFQQIRDPEIKNLLQRLNQHGAIDPAQLSTPFREKIYKAFTDANLAMYIALDGYYQHLYRLDKIGKL